MNNVQDPINNLITNITNYYNNEQYSKALDNLKILYNNRIINEQILNLMINIYLIFENYNKALELINLSINKFPNLSTFQIKFDLLHKINKLELYQSFLQDLETYVLKTSNNELINLINQIKNKIDNFKYISNKQFIKDFTNGIISAEKYNEKLIEYFNLKYLDKIDEYSQLTNTTKESILYDPKVEFRYFCWNYLPIIRQLSHPKIEMGKTNEAVLIEFRCLPHLEFIIRNNIIKLGCEWSYTIICGNLNYEYMVSMCKLISSNIKIIRLNYDNLDTNQYSTLLASVDFWNLFIGEKLLIHQEDTCTFGTNINDFIEWDYIGAAWPRPDNPNHVGNGGFSLRTKKCMIDIIKSKSIHETKYYFEYPYCSVPPEDVYFTINMLNLSIGKLATREQAIKFSNEGFSNPLAFGGHNFPSYDSNWKNLIYSRVICDYIIKYQYILDVDKV
jgi:tetratricopeptide (TPR) repeat protein